MRQDQLAVLSGKQPPHKDEQHKNHDIKADERISELLEKA
jgi:hypothetical protein